MSYLHYDVVIGDKLVRIASVAVEGGHEIAIYNAEDGSLYARKRSGFLDPDFIDAAAADLINKNPKPACRNAALTAVYAAIERQASGSDLDGKALDGLANLLRELRQP